MAEGPVAEEVDFYLTEVTAGGANNLDGPRFVRDHLQGTRLSPSLGEKGMLWTELKDADTSVLAILVPFKDTCILTPV